MTQAITLQHPHAAYYDPNTGRFLQKDSEPGKLQIPSTVLNSYIYVANNPWNLTDPTGHGFWDIFGSVFLGVLIGALSFGVGAFIGAAVGSAFGSGTLATIGGVLFGGIGGGLLGAGLADGLGIMKFKDAFLLYGIIAGVGAAIGVFNPQLLSAGFSSIKIPLTKEFLEKLVAPFTILIPALIFFNGNDASISQTYPL